jgi:hypothetical protein
MPTDFPRTPKGFGFVRAVRLACLVLRARSLSWRMGRASRRQSHIGVDRAGDRLLRLTGRWLAYHRAIADLLGEPEPEDVAKVRQTFSGNPPPPGRSRPE